ncbi:hypothetical protein A3C96_03895 [Candidatus Uhrbacteria bacterium RIFCSPHIGHO2_02_FULL_60_10]|uniref:Uncharacterized protein n=1 Tax=Candidatus Uhrbacteria bacterium RIFCSPHIGHO2_02_FULL_60_10 TaxID=1802392 RepID=A0A1F7U8X6_9BACT|nr:MAG: hypothetical protein A3C96_03895 [Candidatus Uhrbacteria bacterium RIFCSPHIGHO2_02_FULL_60_10]
MTSRLATMRTSLRPAAASTMTRNIPSKSPKWLAMTMKSPFSRANNVGGGQFMVTRIPPKAVQKW